VSESEPFYMPSPDLFRHADAYRMFTSYASKLEEAGLRDRFPADADLRHIAIELLAEREPVENVEEDLELIEDAIAEARGILKEQREQG
jgi:hypothetical protein